MVDRSGSPARRFAIKGDRRQRAATKIGRRATTAGMCVYTKHLHTVLWQQRIIRIAPSASYHASAAGLRLLRTSNQLSATAAAAALATRAGRLGAPRLAASLGNRGLRRRCCLCGTVCVIHAVHAFAHRLADRADLLAGRHVGNGLVQRAAGVVRGLGQEGGWGREASQGGVRCAQANRCGQAVERAASE